jgi:arylsulfatase A-like enzyme
MRMIFGRHVINANYRLLLMLVVGFWQIPGVAGENGARKVVVVVWDGMRPDFVNETNTPALCRLASRGVTFTRHHSTYLSATEVNGTAIATGSYPVHSGLIGNAEYRPQIDSLKPTHTEVAEAVRKGDQVSGGRYLQRPTLPELIRRFRGKAVIAGAKPVALLPDRILRASADQGANVFAGLTLPEGLGKTLINQYGPFPADSVSRRRDEWAGESNPATLSASVTRNDWTTTVLVKTLWEPSVPELSLLWLNQPDASQHASAPGSAESLAGIRNADENLNRVLAALESKGELKHTDIIVVSDHGCSTISSQANVAETLSAAGFKTAREFDREPRRGETLVVSNGGSCMVYVIGHERSVIGKLVEFFQGWKCTGVIFTRAKFPGTFPLSQVHLNSDNAPDILLSFRWSADRNANGAPGMLITDRSNYRAGQGHHGSLSPFDMHNTLIAAGPDFRSGVKSDTPSGNIDIAPTVLWLLGHKPQSMDGRILSEALTIAGPPVKSDRPFVLETSRRNGVTAWHQQLKGARVNGVDYFDEGNGEVTIVW